MRLQLFNAAYYMALQNFAEKTDLIDYWRALQGDDEDRRANTLLKAASNHLRQVARNNGKDLDKVIGEGDTLDELLKENVKNVTLAVVKRAMLTPQDAPPADEWGQSAGVYSQTMKFTNPAGDMFVKSSELELLGFKSVSGRRQFGILRGVR